MLFGLRACRAPIDGVRNPMTELSQVRHTDTAHAATLPASFKQFTAARSTKFFAQIRRHQRRLEKRGTVDICFPAEGEQRIKVLRALAHQKSRWLRRNGLADEFRQPALWEFYERLTSCQVQGGNILVACLRVGDQVAAVLWGAIFGRRYYFLLPSYAEKWRKFSAARILTQSVVQRCIAQGDVRVFDLTIGNERHTHIRPGSVFRPARIPGSTHRQRRRLCVLAAVAQHASAQSAHPRACACARIAIENALATP